MKQWKRLSSAGLALATSVLVACGGSSSNTPAPASVATAELRVIHASGNAPAVNVNVGGEPFEAIQGLMFGEATSRLSLSPAVYSVSVDGVLPAGAVDEVVSPVALDLQSNDITTVIAIGNLGAEAPLAFAPTVLVTPREAVAADDVRVQVVHASAAAEGALPGGVSVYVTAPDVTLDDVMPLQSFNLREDSGPVTVPAGAYQIRITPRGESGEVVFDSGPIALPGGADLMVLAVDNYGPGAPVRLLVSTGEAASDFFINDRSAPADVRVVHAASGVGLAEVFASSDSVGLADVRVIPNEARPEFAYRDDISLTGLTPADDYIFKVNAQGGGAASAPIAAGPITLAPATFYTVLAAGDLPQAGDADLTLLQAEDDRRSVFTEVRVRAIHAASQAGTVAVFITPAGEETVTSIELGDVAPAIAEFDYESVTGYIALDEGGYDVRVAVPQEAGGYKVAIDLSGVHLSNGNVVTLVATNPADDGDDFAFVALFD
jgi:trimeric autotransporter adhesin